MWREDGKVFMRLSRLFVRGENRDDMGGIIAWRAALFGTGAVYCSRI